MFAPETFSIAVTFGGIFWKFAASIKKQMDKKDTEFMTSVDSRLQAIEDSSEAAHKDMRMEILRLQILDGIDAERLSISEVEFFYDKYKALGGDSFVTSKVEEYVQKLKGEHKQ